MGRLSFRKVEPGYLVATPTGESDLSPLQHLPLGTLCLLQHDRQTPLLALHSQIRNAIHSLMSAATTLIAEQVEMFVNSERASVMETQDLH